MSTIGTITLNDAQGTPVSHVFAPASTPNDAANYEDRSASQYIGFNKLFLGLERPKGATNGGTRNIKLRIRLETPKLENTTNSTVSGIAPAPTVSYRPMAELVVTLPERCSLQDRKDLQKYFLQLMAATPVTELFEKYEVPY